MARYFQVSPRFWQHNGARGWSDDEKLMGVYLLTSPHRRTEGLFALPMEYLSHDLEWELERCGQVLEQLIDREFVKYDPDAGVVLVVNALRYQAPRGAKSIAGALASVEEVPPSRLLFDLWEAASNTAPEFAEALSKRYPALLDAPSKGHQHLSAPSLALAPSLAQAQAQEHRPAVAGGEAGKKVVQFDRKRVPLERLELAERLLGRFNAEAGTSHGAYTGRGKPSESLKRIIGALADHPDVDEETWIAAIRWRLHHGDRFWGTAKPDTGVVFGPKVVAANLENATRSPSRPGAGGSLEDLNASPLA